MLIRNVRFERQKMWNHGFCAIQIFGSNSLFVLFNIEIKTSGFSQGVRNKLQDEVILYIIYD